MRITEQYRNYRRLLLEDDSGGGSGGGSGGAIEVLGGVDPTSGGGSDPSGGDAGAAGGEAGGGAPAPGGGAPASTVAMSPEALAKALQLAGLGGQQGAQGQQQPELTPEQKKELLRIWEPDDAYLERFSNLETQKQAFIELRDGLINQIDTLLQARLYQNNTELNARIDPVLTGWQKQQEAAREERFFSKYEVLKNDALRPILSSVAQSIAQSGQNFETEEAAFEALAKGVEALIKTTNPQFTLTTAGGGSPAVTPTRSSTPASAIPVTTPGAGGSGGGGAAPTKGGALGILGPVR